MSSDLESALKTIQMNDYAAIVTVIILVYDYVLTFSREIDYIWHRPWGLVTILFIVVRYIGLCWNIAYALAGSTFVPGPVEAPYLHCKRCLDANSKLGVSAPFTVRQNGVWIFFEGTTMLLIGNWGYVLFLAAADLVMILRVYAIWNRSRVISGVLLSIAAAQIVICLVWYGIYENPNKNFSVAIVQVLDFKYCSFSFHSTSFLVIYRAIPRFVLCVTLLVLAITPTIKEAAETYRLTKHWQIRRYMKLLIREGVLYFILTLLFNILTVIRPGSPTDLMLFLVALSYSVSCVIMPRFIISIREWHDHDLQDRGLGIDVGFGIFSQLLAGENITMPVVVFADVVPGEGQTRMTEGNGRDSQAVQLEIFGDGAGQV